MRPFRHFFARLADWRNGSPTAVVVQRLAGLHSFPRSDVSLIALPLLLGSAGAQVKRFHAPQVIPFSPEKARKSELQKTPRLRLPVGSVNGQSIWRQAALVALESRSGRPATIKRVKPCRKCLNGKPRRRGKRLARGGSLEALHVQPILLGISDHIET